MKHFTLARRAVFIGVIVIAMGGLIYFLVRERIDLQWCDYLQDNTHPVVLIILFLILPVVGFPISVFLLLLGVRFDPAPALLIMFAGMAVHQGITFPAGNTLLRPAIEKILARRKIALPQFSEKGFVWPSIIFMAVPGLSYTLKNYILSLSGIPFRYFFFIAWLVQAVMGIPMVLAGDAVGGRHAKLLMALFGLMAGIYALKLWLVRGRGQKRG
jgi:uncharacterized membrane protein YdjX (TVP38/TMEM64 family)